MIQQEPSVVDRLHSDFSQLIHQIDAAEISLRNSAEEIFQKSLYMAIGSYFEQRITGYILKFIGKLAGNSVLVIEFARNKAISRQYHTYFNWNGANVNSFFGLFGGEFRDYMKEYVNNNAEYGEAIKAFLDVGNVRNEVAHDFGAVSLTKTTDEIYALYKKALVFVEQTPLHFDEFMESRQEFPEQT